MGTNLRNTEATFLEEERMALENAQTQPTIRQEMQEMGYDQEAIAEGQALYDAALAAYQNNQTEDDETAAAYANFSSFKDQLTALYRMHRKKAKVVFRKDPLTREKLAIAGQLPKSHTRWIQGLDKFYATALGDTDIQTQLSRLKITEAELSEGKSLIEQVQTARFDYKREVGESENATKIKDAAFATLDDWMSEFRAVARIALEDQPQLLEALGINVPS